MKNKIVIRKDLDKNQAFDAVASFLEKMQIAVVSKDETRPWGGFFCIAESDTQKFVDTFFNDVPVDKISVSEKLSPKILLVEKYKRLSWQYHHRRAEIWKVIGGTVKVVLSDNDEETEPISKKINDIITIKKGQRHRLIGADEWGIIAEIWQHTHSQPSDEQDIVRVSDDFGR